MTRRSFVAGGVGGAAVLTGVATGALPGKARLKAQYHDWFSPHPHIPSDPEGVISLEQVYSHARGKTVDLFTAVPHGYGKGAGLPVCLVLHGVTASPSDYERFGLQFNFNPDAAPTLTEADLINAAYLPITATPFGWNALSAYATNAIFVGPVVPQLNSLSAQQLTQTWYYRFDWNEEPVPFNTVYGATHAMDLPFIFSNFGTSVFSFAFSTANKTGREALSDSMLRSVAAFAKTGNPNNASLGVTWPNWPAKLVFDASPTQVQIAVQ